MDYEVQRIVDLGAHIIYNTTVGKDISMDDLKACYNAVIVAIGTSEAKMLPMFEHNICTESAISFLARAKESKGNLEDLPQNVLVIGGGDVAMDVVTTLKKLNVPYVTDIVYEQFDEFKASKKELAGAQEAGVTIVDGYVPKEVHQNRATFTHRKIKSELTITADKIILAVGQKANAEGLDIDLQHVRPVTIRSRRCLYIFSSIRKYSCSGPTVTVIFFVSYPIRWSRRPAEAFSASIDRSSGVFLSDRKSVG